MWGHSELQHDDSVDDTEPLVKFLSEPAVWGIGEFPADGLATLATAMPESVKTRHAWKTMEALDALMVRPCR